ncbi:hypothetical protein LDENG_00030970, partial [Lucifuga dentata]
QCNFGFQSVPPLFLPPPERRCCGERKSNGETKVSQMCYLHRVNMDKSSPLASELTTQQCDDLTLNYCKHLCSTLSSAFTHRSRPPSHRQLWAHYAPSNQEIGC